MALGYEIFEYSLGQSGVELLCDYIGSHKSRAELADICSARIHGQRKYDTSSKDHLETASGSCNETEEMDGNVPVDV